MKGSSDSAEETAASASGQMSTRSSISKGSSEQNTEAQEAPAIKHTELQLGSRTWDTTVSKTHGLKANHRTLTMALPTLPEEEKLTKAVSFNFCFQARCGGAHL